MRFLPAALSVAALAAPFCSVRADGLTAASPRPNDLAVAGRYLYAINSAVGEVTAYRISDDGRLTPMPVAANLGTLAGLAAR